jgi:hypothetical protein
VSAPRNDHLTITESKDVLPGEKFVEFRCSKCGGSLRLLLPVNLRDLKPVSDAFTSTHQHRRGE